MLHHSACTAVTFARCCYFSLLYKPCMKIGLIWIFPVDYVIGTFHILFHNRNFILKLVLKVNSPHLMLLTSSMHKYLLTGFCFDLLIRKIASINVLKGKRMSWIVVLHTEPHYDCPQSKSRTKFVWIPFDKFERKILIFNADASTVQELFLCIWITPMSSSLSLQISYLTVVFSRDSYDSKFTLFSM